MYKKCNTRKLKNFDCFIHPKFFQINLLILKAKMFYSRLKIRLIRYLMLGTFCVARNNMFALNISQGISRLDTLALRDGQYVNAILLNV